ncbi:MAG: hypothetical protein RLZZ568_830 [Cyanobacteriota bacterium]|jgi:ABC-2 type transport system permease protein
MVTIYNLLAIFRKEFLSYFSSPFSYGVAAIFWLMSGAFFSLTLSQLLGSVELARQAGFTDAIDVPGDFLTQYLGLLISLILVLLPALSMGLYAEERKQGTLELLATSPVTNWVVAVGKLLGALVFFSVLLIPLWIYQIIIFNAATPSLPLDVILLANLAVILVAAAILSLGMFISSLTANGIIAYILTFTLVLALWILDVLAQNLDGAIARVFSYLSLFQTYQDLIAGLLSSQSLILLASYIFLGIFLTAQSIEALRFQRS